MSSRLELNRAIAYRYILRVAFWPAAIIAGLLIALNAGVIWAATSVSLWWLIFLLPLGIAVLVLVVVGAILIALLKGLQPRKLSHHEKRQIKQFIDSAQQTLASANGLRYGPLTIIIDVLRKKRRNRSKSLAEIILEPLNSSHQLRAEYQRLLSEFGRKRV